MSSRELIHRFELEGKRFAIDPETCFCFECDAISWDVLGLYPREPVNRIYDLLKDQYPREELMEVVGELEWLRATKSILVPPTKESQAKIFEVDRGLKRLVVELDEGEAEGGAPERRRWFGRGTAGQAPAAREFDREAAALLLSRSGGQAQVELVLLCHGVVDNIQRTSEIGAHALKLAQLAGKTFSLAVRVEDVEIPDLPPAFEGHTLSYEVEFKEQADIASGLERAKAACARSLAKLAGAIAPNEKGASGRLIIRPNHPGFGKVVEEADKAGFTVVELDLDGAYAANPGLEPDALLPALHESAVYYAQRLLEHHYFRVDPMASLFWRIYSGEPVLRADGAGTNELAIAANGDLFPSRLLMNDAELRVGSLSEGAVDEDALRRFDDVGSVTTAPCMRCWARHLCGGGCAAVHRALTGFFRTPNESWCEGQRAWMGAAVSAFNRLSEAGIHFERIYKVLGKPGKLSLFTAARAALTMSISARPLVEADAEQLTTWENWNESAYFLFNEMGILLATRYDREMDSLHPRGTDQEMMLTHRDGTPLGLLKVSPGSLPETAIVALWMREAGDYANPGVRRSFRAFLKQAMGEQGMRNILAPVGPRDPGLAEFLEAVGLVRHGVAREALYLHGAYHDVTIMGATLSDA